MHIIMQRVKNTRILTKNILKFEKKTSKLNRHILHKGAGIYKLPKRHYKNQKSKIGHKQRTVNKELKTKQKKSEK